MRERMRIGQIGLTSVIGLVLLAGACTKLPPNISPEGATAIRGRQVVTAARAGLAGVEIVTDSRLAVVQADVTAGKLDPKAGAAKADAVKADARVAIGGLREVGVQAVTLADALDVLDKAKDAAAQKDGLDKVRAIISSIQTAVLTIPTNIGDETIRQSLATFMGEILRAITEVTLVLPRPATSG